MALFKSIDTLDDLFAATLRQLYYAEKQIADTLPTMIEKANNPELRAGFDQHLRETENQVRRLEEVFRIRGEDPDADTCPAIDGIIKAAKAMAGDIADREVLDAGLIAGAQLVEHYEIAQYGTLIAWSRELGSEEAASVLQQTLQEEKATDQKLTQLAEARINRRAEASAGA